MIVTDPDIIIADYAVKSYAKIKDIPFKLRIYSNWISIALKQRYFPAWKKYDFVEIEENNWQLDENKPTNRHLEGPFETMGAIFDRELKKIDTPYYATVDADFEILDANFINIMLAHLDANPGIIAMSTEYTHKKEVYDTYSNEVIILNERWHTWFCIYKRESLKCAISHAFHEEIVSSKVRRNDWDCSGYFQKDLKDTYGYEIAVLDPIYPSSYIHYGAFSKNRELERKNIGLYRILQIIRTRGFFGKRNAISSKFANYWYRIFFGKVDRKHFWPGWGV
jgi:hypothetical protein